jgi:hypothetical protein
VGSFVQRRSRFATGSVNQELSLAAAKDLSGYLSLNYVGIPGWTFGGTYFTGKAGQGVQDFPAQNARVTLWEGHVRWQPGPFDFAALYSRGTISDTEALNLTFIGQPTPVPQLFYGGYVQGAWRNIWQYNDYALTPFTRYEWVNTAAAYASVPQGLGYPRHDRTNMDRRCQLLRHAKHCVQGRLPAVSDRFVPQRRQFRTLLSATTMRHRWLITAAATTLAPAVQPARRRVCWRRGGPARRVSCTTAFEPFVVGADIKAEIARDAGRFIVRHQMACARRRRISAGSSSTRSSARSSSSPMASRSMPPAR